MKKQFVLYTDYLAKYGKLSDEQFGQVFRAILAHENGQEVEISDQVAAIVFEAIKYNLDEDREKWEKKKKANQENGKLGGRPKIEPTQPNPKKPTGFSNNPQKGVTVTDTVTGNSEELSKKAQPPRGIAKSLFDNLSEIIPDLVIKHRVSEKTIRDYQQKYILWIEQKKTDKNRQNRDMKASVEAWIVRDLSEGKLKKLDIYPTTSSVDQVRQVQVDRSAVSRALSDNRPSWMKGSHV